MTDRFEILNENVLSAVVGLVSWQHIKASCIDSTVSPRTDDWAANRLGANLGLAIWLLKV